MKLIIIHLVSEAGREIFVLLVPKPNVNSIIDRKGEIPVR
jgi:hypothetical protein